jgi:DNA-binding NtrC family response regulator
MGRILLVDDEPQLCRILSMLLIERGHLVEVAPNGVAAVQLSQQVRPDLAIIDVNLPGMSGLEVFTTLRQYDSTLPGVFITAFGTIPSAIAAMRAGAFDYLTKPFDNEELLLTVERALELRGLKQEVGRLKEELDGRVSFPGIVGRSPGIQDVLRVLPRIAASDAVVLIYGESGTGKELIARNIHRHSRRSDGPFVAVNCSAIPSGLVETEFFGHERGAYTDARESRAGRFEQADKGSLFLDEVGELPLEAQAKLLRVLEEREVSRVGSRKAIPVDVRILAATNRNLDDEVARGRFRADLYWRLAVVPVRLPALRERRDDLPLLIDHFLDRLSNERGVESVGLSVDARAALLAHDWPGNVRELENVLKRAVILSDAPVIDVKDIQVGRSVRASADDSSPDSVTLAEAIARATDRIERSFIQATLDRHRGNRTATADTLGINRKTLFNKMKYHRLTQGREETEP